MPNIYQGNTGLGKGEAFFPATGVALCGFSQNQYNVSATTLQAKIGALEPSKLLPCTPVIINNDNTEANGTGNMTGFNPKTFVISKAAASASDVIDGFILESPQNIVDSSGNAGLPLEHGVVPIAKIGSGIEVFLPCNANLVNVSLSTALYWDTTNKEITTVNTGTCALTGVKLLSSVVNGKRRKLNTNTVEWEDCTCVLVKL